MSKKFENPYADCDYRADTGRRLIADISIDDFNYVRALRPKDGTLQTTINLLWHKLVAELKRRDIVPYSEENRMKFEHLVSNCQLTLPDDYGKRPTEQRETSVPATTTEPGPTNDRAGGPTPRPVGPETAKSDDGRGVETKSPTVTAESGKSPVVQGHRAGRRTPRRGKAGSKKVNP